MSTAFNPPTALSYTPRIPAYLQSVEEAVRLLCNEIGKARATEYVERQALKDLHKGAKNLHSDILAYRVLLGAITLKNIAESSPDKTERAETERAEIIQSLEHTCEAMRLLLDGNPAGLLPGATMKPSGGKRPRRALKIVLGVLKTDFQSGDLYGLIDELKDATYEILVCQQNNERAFKPLWYRHVVTRQQVHRTSSVYDISSIQDRVRLALKAVLGAFHVYPFAVSPERIHRRYGPHIFAILNHNHKAATRHQKLARQLGKAWVDDRVPADFNDGQVQELGALKTFLFELLWSGTVEQLKRDSPYSEDPERTEFKRALGELETVLKKAIVVFPSEQQFTIALCGTVKAGKSLFLNVLMGRALLPSDEFPSTAWPCRFRHVAGQISPALQFHAEPFLVALKKLQDRQYGRKMQTYQPPPENMFEKLPLSDPLNEETLLRTIHSQWVNLHAVTRDNLLKFETPGFKLHREAHGDMNVKILLDQLNDIVRLCQQFGLGFDMNEGDWPLVNVEFSSLRDHRISSIYEFIDLPVIGEGFCDTNFESLARLVASDANAIVPFMSFKELSHSDWKRLPALVASGFNGRANVAVCTHLDQLSQKNMDDQLKTVTKEFWPRGVLNTNRVIPCSLMGLSARYLLDRSNSTKPPFEAIWNKHSMGYRCAAKILGEEDPRGAYDRIGTQMWRRKLQAELRASGLPADIQQLTQKMVDSARVNTLLSEADTVIRQLREMRTIYEQKLSIEAKRIEAEYDAAKRRCDEALKTSQAVLETLGRVGSIQAQEVRSLLEKELGMISQRACESINQTITKTSTDGGMSLENMDVGHGTRRSSSGKRFGGVQLGNGDINDKSLESSSAEARHGNILVTETRSQAKDFLRLSQRELSSALEMLKEECTAIILDVAGTESAKLLKAVHGMIKQAELQPPPEDWETRFGELGKPSLNIDGLAFRDISGVINTRQLSLFNRQYCIEIDTLHDRFKGEIIDPWIRKLKEEGETTLLGTIGTVLMTAKDWITSALLERELRCKRELEKKEMLDGEEAVERLTAVYNNLLAAEEALKELLARVKALEI